MLTLEQRIIFNSWDGPSAVLKSLKGQQMAEEHGGFFRQPEQIRQRTARDQARAQQQPIEISPTEKEVDKAVVVTTPPPDTPTATTAPPEIPVVQPASPANLPSTEPSTESSAETATTAPPEPVPQTPIPETPQTAS